MDIFEDAIEKAHEKHPLGTCENCKFMEKHRTGLQMVSGNYCGFHESWIVSLPFTSRCKKWKQAENN